MVLFPMPLTWDALLIWIIFFLCSTCPFRQRRPGHTVMCSTSAWRRQRRLRRVHLTASGARVGALSTLSARSRTKCGYKPTTTCTRPPGIAWLSLRNSPKRTGEFQNQPHPGILPYKEEIVFFLFFLHYAIFSH